MIWSQKLTLAAVRVLLEATCCPELVEFITIVSSANEAFCASNFIETVAVYTSLGT